MTVLNESPLKKIEKQRAKLTVTHYANGIKVPEELLHECAIDNPIIEELIAQTTNIRRKDNEQ